MVRDVLVDGDLVLDQSEEETADLVDEEEEQVRVKEIEVAYGDQDVV